MTGNDCCCRPDTVVVVFQLMTGDDCCCRPDTVIVVSVDDW